MAFYFFPAFPARAQQEIGEATGGRRVVEAMRLLPTDRLELDGRPDEAFWERIRPATGFRQQEPLEGEPATERTEVRVAYDDHNLYLGVMLYDSEPQGIKAFQRRRDASLATDDRFMWILDTFEDGRNAYLFEINPAGLMGDGLLRIGQGTSINKAWDGIWRAWVVQDAYGWSAEIRIPFRTLDFDPNHTTWGINFQRTVRRKNEEMLWTGHQRHQGLFRPQDAGQLVGLDTLSQGFGLELKPYAITSLDRTGPANEPSSRLRADAGFDATYSITPNLRAAITVNTDFAETNVDQRQVNLTRFPLFFPEQRDFFLEGSSIFQFAPGSNIYPYFSRRIGLVEGQPIPIRYGGRLAGRVGDYNLGLLQIRTGQAGQVPAEDFTVGRLVRNIGRESTVGVIYTRRSTDGLTDGPDPLPDRHTAGADLELGTSRFLRNKNLQFQAFFVLHNGIGPADDTAAWHQRTSRGLRLSFPNQPWSGHVSYREFGDRFEPAVGFVPRRSFRRLQPSVAYSPLLPRSRLFREMTFELYHEHLMDLSFRPATVFSRVTPLGFRLESGDLLQVQLTRNFEWLDFDFDIRRDGSIIIPEGEYTVYGYSLGGQTAPFRKVVGSGNYTRTGFWSGTRTQYDAGLTIRPLAGLNLTGEWSHTQVQLREGSFDTHLFRFIGHLDPSPWTSFSTILQYDNLSQVAGLNARFRWIITPGTDLYFVYNHNWQDHLERLETLESQTILKLTYTHRF